MKEKEKIDHCSIKQAQESDIPNILALQKEGTQEGFLSTTHSEEQLRSCIDSVYVLRDECDIVGFMLCIPRHISETYDKNLVTDADRYLYEDEPVSSYNYFVGQRFLKPGYRGNGWGRDFVSHAKLDLRDKYPGSLLVFEGETTNPQSGKSSEAGGAKEVGRRKIKTGDLVMRVLKV